MSVKGKIRILKLKIKGISKQNTFKRKIKYCHFFNLAKKNNVVSFRLDRVAQDYTNDYFADTGIPTKEKEWYYQKGFATYKISWYSLTKSTINNYISDFDFYNSTNYADHSFINWFEHKLNTYYLLSPFKENMPIHYYYKKDKRIITLNGKAKTATVDDVIRILNDNPIALKACIGGHGQGFYKIEKKGEGYYVNNNLSDRANVEKIISDINNYIITSYSIPNGIFRKACGEKAFAVIRAVTVYDDKNGPQITALIIRLGTNTDKVVCDYDGTINCGIDLNTGKLFNPLYRTGDAEGIIIPKSLENHPDTGYNLESIVIPNFEKLCSLVKDVSAYLPVTPYLVMDIIPTDTGFDILEINSHGQLRVLEPWYPVRLNPAYNTVFNMKDR